jgi:hypothetical protein
MLFVPWTGIVTNYIYQQMHTKHIKLQVIFTHNLSYMFRQIFAIFWGEDNTKEFIQALNYQVKTYTQCYNIHVYI